ncbi:hypothetical protein OHS33_34725 [Streptomyces sp. NBC_00536]|uniref:hypothetical protein n=1 Tax=Streptomyces sp. NBC_00536 TaxID=2975769 RepID=UPI002E7FC47F|nr:hypothetical protein [Streptomyces sp. NBC_00536]WUC83073.1 hypothetical protein OHS33_34725 [Streptomyces sp. NBC_00536]
MSCPHGRLGPQAGPRDTATALAAVWDVFGLTAELADGIAFDEGSDELQAILSAQKCEEGQRLLPLPETGPPVVAPPPEPGAAGLVPYGRLLEHVTGALTRLSAVGAADEGSARALLRIGELASDAARALSYVREDG